MIEQDGGEEYGKDFPNFYVVYFMSYVCMESWESESKTEGLTDGLLIVEV